MKKQILFVIESLHCGGAEKSLVTLLNNLDYSLLDVSLLLFRKEGSFEKFLPKEIKVKYYEHLSFNNKKIHILKRIRFWILKKANTKKKMHTSQLFWKSIGKYLPELKGNNHITIAYNQGFSTYFVSQLVKSEKKYAWINTDYIKAGYNPSFDYKFYKSFNKVVTVSPESKDSFINSMKNIGKEVNAIVIKDIVDKGIIQSMGKEQPLYPFDNTCINLVTVARLTELKGLDQIPKSCRILIDKGYKIHWYIVGEGIERKNIEHQVKELGLENYITLVGFTDNPYSYMNACDIYVQTSYFEGLGLSLIEASLLNKPIVTTNFTTADSIIENKVTGLICKMNSNDIAQHIELFINDDNLRNKAYTNLTNKELKDNEVSLTAFYSLIGLS
ncbi:MAG: glycosyltransferase [Dysgonomonas sp.]|nr:glycosyltransferase [Dysgonomonas sp.]